jgi:hypothetical protein
MPNQYQLSLNRRRITRKHVAMSRSEILLGTLVAMTVFLLKTGVLVYGISNHAAASIIPSLALMQ